MQLNTDFKLAGPLAGLFGGITQAQDQEAKGLLNAYQGLKNQEQQYTSAEAQAKLQDPQYLQMKLKNDMSKFGQETSLNEIETAYNNANRALSHLKAAQAMGPEALQQASVQYLTEMKIDPNSQKGQFLLQDPVGNAEKLTQFYATAATNNPKYMQQYGLEEAKSGFKMKEQAAQDDAAKERQQISSGAMLQGQQYAADRAFQTGAVGMARNAYDNVLKYDKLIAAAESDPASKAIAAKIKASSPEFANVDDSKLIDTLKQNRKEAYDNYKYFAGSGGFKIPASSDEVISLK